VEREIKGGQNHGTSDDTTEAPYFIQIELTQRTGDDVQCQDNQEHQQNVFTAGFRSPVTLR
jgi:hypothetical protein